MPLRKKFTTSIFRGDEDEVLFNSQCLLVLGVCILIAGVDEAGRGPCVGPMVIAVTCIKKNDEEKLSQIGVKDSKMLSEKERERQFAEIVQVVSEFSFVRIDATEIDELRNRKSLNEVEAMRIGELLNGLKTKPELIYVDSPDPISSNFAKRIRKYINFNPIIKAEHKADVNYPIVSAASIIAKVERDHSIKELEKEYGVIGSGYPHDELTITFLKKYLHQYNQLPVIARKSWITTQRILDGKLQKRLTNWGME